MKHFIRLTGDGGEMFVPEDNIDLIEPDPDRDSCGSRVIVSFGTYNGCRLVEQSPEEVARLLGWLPPEEQKSIGEEFAEIREAAKARETSASAPAAEPLVAGYDEHLGPVDSDGAPARPCASLEPAVSGLELAVALGDHLAEALKKNPGKGAASISRDVLMVLHRPKYREHFFPIFMDQEAPADA